MPFIPAVLRSAKIILHNMDFELNYKILGENGYIIIKAVLWNACGLLTCIIVCIKLDCQLFNLQFHYVSSPSQIQH